MLGKIIEARGCVVQDEEFRGLRSGRRAEGSGQLAPTVRKHQRLMEMASTVPHIEDIAEAKAMIRSGLQGRALMASPWLRVGVYLRDVYSGLLVACASHGALRPAAFL